jgi:L-fuculose-phosphate aldolase
MPLIDQFRPEVEAFIGVCHALARDLYVTGHGGNLAWRLRDDLILITPTQMNKGAITRGDVVFIDPDGKTVEGIRRPTGETPMYVTFFKERPDIRSVVHCHPPHVCAAAIAKGENWLMKPFYPEVVTEVGPVPMVPYAEPLTQTLADNFKPFLRKYDSFLMQNHGLVTVTRKDIAWTHMMVQLLEMGAKSVLLALGAGDVQPLDRQHVHNLSNVMKTRDLPLFGAPGVNDSLEELYYPEG